MPVRSDIPYKEGMFFIAFTCHKWMSLIAQTDSYDLIYHWFDYLQKQQHRIAGYVIMPNHVHVLIDFAASTKKINTIIGNGKRFIAYELVNRLEKAGEIAVLQQLEKAVLVKDKNNGKKHAIWQESFDWKYCETATFAYQKLFYMHHNPCTGKWKLAEDITKYEHSSARYYITGKHAEYEVVDVEQIIGENMPSP
jgi:REP element-mobilizing transposase RayT